MSYTSEFKRFVTSQYIYAAVRVTLAVVLPSIILAYFGVLKELFLFPLATSFIGLTDQPGPVIRRRNSMLLAVLCFFIAAAVAGLAKGNPIFIFIELLVFGFFFSMIGIYGQRLSAVGSLTLIVLAIFIDGHLTGNNALKSLSIFLAGSLWFVLIFLIITRLQPYKLASQQIGENYILLGEYLKIRAQLYLPNPKYDIIFDEIITHQIKIKNLQEDTRETVFRTRQIIKESTTTSRLLMLMFLNSIDLHEKLMTSESDYKTLHQDLKNQEVLSAMNVFLLNLAAEITNIGIDLQSGIKSKPLANVDDELDKLYTTYYDYRNKELSAENLENFMILRQILLRITELSSEIKNIYKVFSQDIKLAKSLSSGLDLRQFLSKEEKLNFKVFRNNLSLNSKQFRHAIRVTLALLIGYGITRISFFPVGHAYWVLITIVAIIRPNYSITKHRNYVRLLGTLCGALLSYYLLWQFSNNGILLFFLLTSMILAFSFLKGKYFWAVFFITIYVFLAFNFLKPGNINVIFKDRIFDTFVGGIVVYLVSYFVLPVWEHTQNLDLMKAATQDNIKYFKSVMQNFEVEKTEENVQEFKINRKAALVSLANLSDNFQRMLSDPKNQQKKLEKVHQFVTTSHLFTAYTASLSQYFSGTNLKKYPEIDAQKWTEKISSELQNSLNILNNVSSEFHQKELEIPENEIEFLLNKRKQELELNEITDRRDPTKISHLAELNNITELLELMSDVAREQRKALKDFQPFIAV
ncbi:FUSC family membrane protein [Halpernia sp.]|uniref:FUSC family protein n=1 Tax=Halpernia sp. TaxID=2782209 RepID=UPI003A8F9CB6